MRPVCLARLSPSLVTRTRYLLPLRRPPGASTISSDWWPNISLMSLRSLRAAAPVSSSASTMMCPLLRCSPSANLSNVDTSALRQHGLSTITRLSSSLTRPVSAISAPPRSSLPLEYPPECACQPPRVMPIGPPGQAQVCHHQPSAEPVGRRAKFRDCVLDCGPVGQHDVNGQVGSMAGQHLQVGMGREPLGLPRLRRQVQRHDPP